MRDVADIASNNPKQTSYKSPDQEIEATRANRLEIKGTVASSKFSILAEKQQMPSKNFVGRFSHFVANFQPNLSLKHLYLVQY